MYESIPSQEQTLLDRDAKFRTNWTKIVSLFIGALCLVAYGSFRFGEMTASNTEAVVAQVQWPSATAVAANNLGEAPVRAGETPGTEQSEAPKKQDGKPEICAKWTRELVMIAEKATPGTVIKSISDNFKKHFQKIVGGASEKENAKQENGKWVGTDPKVPMNVIILGAFNDAKWMEICNSVITDNTGTVENGKLTVPVRIEKGVVIKDGQQLGPESRMYAKAVIDTAKGELESMIDPVTSTQLMECAGAGANQQPQPEQPQPEGLA